MKKANDWRLVPLLVLTVLSACSSPSKATARNEVDWDGLYSGYGGSYSLDRSASLASMTVGK